MKAAGLSIPRVTQDSPAPGSDSHRDGTGSRRLLPKGRSPGPDQHPLTAAGRGAGSFSVGASWVLGV